MSDAFDLFPAGNQALEPAQKDFDELRKLVKDKKVRSEGVILVQRGDDGAPPLLASVAVGAAAQGIRPASLPATSPPRTSRGHRTSRSTARCVVASASSSEV